MTEHAVETLVAAIGLAISNKGAGIVYKPIPAGAMPIFPDGGGGFHIGTRQIGSILSVCLAPRLFVEETARCDGAANPSGWDAEALVFHTFRRTRSGGDEAVWQLVYRAPLLAVTAHLGDWYDEAVALIYAALKDAGHGIPRRGLLATPDQIAEARAADKARRADG